LAAPELYPAVDILGGRAVRLIKGDFRRRTTYADHPIEAARDWVVEGARRLHVVDLDGAREGTPMHLEQLTLMAHELRVPVQYGGGLRSVESARMALDAGAARIVLGTAAFKDTGVLDALLESHADRLAVAVDVRGGKVSTGGWAENTELDAIDAIEGLLSRGVRTIVFTDVDVDGTLEGPDTRVVRRASRAARDASLVYSGGISSLEDLESLAGLRLPNLEGVIVGKALYEHRFTVTDALGALGHIITGRGGVGHRRESRRF
jgi:phosphoribosylformimino-5-aminoimidazole carboxamide ribotide isomerase